MRGLALSISDVELLGGKFDGFQLKIENPKEIIIVAVLSKEEIDVDDGWFVDVKGEEIKIGSTHIIKPTGEKLKYKYFKSIRQNQAGEKLLQYRIVDE